MRPLVIAHRGASLAAPENTLAAVRAALEIGVDGVEIDVHETRDGGYVVVHDDTLDRTTNGRGPVSARTAAEVTALDAGAWFGPAFATERVPRLEDVVALVDGRARLFIEVKSIHGPGAASIDRLVAAIGDAPGDAVVVQSFSDRILAAARDRRPDLELHKLVGAFRPPIAYRDTRWRLGLPHLDGMRALNLHHASIDARAIAFVRSRGLRVHAWTVDAPREAQRLAALGCDGIITNDPATIRTASSRAHETT